ncbi:peptidase S8/S53 domain-containing protein [Leptodontidium sp. MPI-SDFR-AT-0119]|nr:peptidase S8/S53 domain-containing protein [Leptodontidium sp. MPI-SDFR-AT-0119]
MVGKIYSNYALPFRQREKLIEIFLSYKSDDIDFLAASLYFLLSENLQHEAADEDDNDELSELEIPWPEYVGQKRCQSHPYLVTRPGRPHNNGQTNLEFAVSSKAEWAVPSAATASDFPLEDQAKLRDVLGKDETVLYLAVQTAHVGLVEKIIELNQQFGIKLPSKGRLLQTAIQKKNGDILDMILEASPNLVEQRGDNRSALQELRSLPSFSDKIRMEKSLISRIMHLEDFDVVRELLYDSSRHPKELCFDLSHFSDPSHDFRKFIGNLDNFPIELEAILSYVQIPEVLDPVETILETDRRDAEIVLKWLVGKKNVSEIIELRVSDSMYNHHREETIERSLLLFESIEILDWRKPDLSIETLKVVRGLKTVWLYSSGNWGPLGFWTGDEGLRTLDALEMIHIVFIKDIISEKRIEDYKRRVSDRLDRQKKLLAERTNRKLEFTLESQLWNVSAASIGQMSQRNIHTVEPHKLLRLEGFLKVYRTLCNPNLNPSKRWTPVKVCIIDTGIDISATKLANSVGKGKSFVHTRSDRKLRESPWYLASEAHGTQMASLIHDVDPYCKLYIAKVGLDRESTINPKDIQDAIDWAVKEEVDVISMSMSYRNEHEGIYKALQKVHTLGIVFLCSTEDRGRQTTLAYPASHTQETISIAACNEVMTLLPQSDDRAFYYFQGENVRATSLSYSDFTNVEVTGSSVATALAAGVASLILSCRNFANPTSTMLRKAMVKRVFDDMVQEKGGKSRKPCFSHNRTLATFPNPTFQASSPFAS